MTILIWGTTLSLAQPTSPADWGLKRFMIKDKKIGEIGFYMDTINISKKTPLLVYINGSGGYPLCLYVKRDSSSIVFTTFEDKVAKMSRADYHFIIIDKPGLTFCDSIESEEKNISKLLEGYHPPKYYTENLSLDWRVRSTKSVITYLIKNGYWDESKLVVWGFSEGAQVVPKVATEDKRITHLVSIVGAGLNQFYDFIVTTRVKVAKGELTHEQGQNEIEALLGKIKDIYENKNLMDKEFQGHTYKRWSSFCAESSVDNLIRLDIPIYMLAGTADSNSPIYGLDYVPLEFLRLGKTNLTYDVCIGCDHFQTVIETADSGEKGKSLNDYYITKVMDWIKRN